MNNKNNLPSTGNIHDKDLSIFDKNPIIPDCSVYGLIKLLSVFSGSCTSLECYDLSITYNELNELVNIISKSLIELGVSKDDIITIKTPNIIQSTLIFLAANNIGATVTFLNDNASDEEIRKYLNLYETNIYFNFGKNIDESSKEIKGTKVQYVITIDKSDLLRIPSLGHKNIENDKFLSFEDFLNCSLNRKGLLLTKNSKKQNSIILYTSGSTGKPKPVVLTNENILASAMYMKNTTKVKVSNKEKSMCIVPFNYPYGFITSVLMSLLCQKDTILADGINVKNIYNYIMKYQPNIIQAIPSFYLSMMGDKRFENANLSFLTNTVSGGDFMSADNSMRFVDFLREHNSNANFCNGSGSAELAGCGTSSYGRDYNPYSVGRVLAGTKCKVTNPETGKELGYNEEGILHFGGKHVFKEYFNDPEGTAKVRYVDEDGVTWYKSDTIGKIDSNGEVYILGRERRFMITYSEDGNPYKVYCDYVQSFINKLPEVESCVVVKKPDENRSYVPKAYIVLNKEYKNKEAEEIIEHIKNQLSFILDENGVPLKEYEIPTEFELIDYMPLAESQKVDYNFLEKKASEEYNNQMKLQHII